MFDETNEILVLCVKGKDYSVYRLQMDAEAKRKYLQLFNEGVDNIIRFETEDRDEVQFSSSYKLNDDEVFTIQDFQPLPCIKNALDHPDTLEPFIPKNPRGDLETGHKMKAILAGRKISDADYIIAGQKFSATQTLWRKPFQLFLDGQTFTVPRPSFSITISNDVDCVFINGKLLFLNYTSANKVFDLSEYYRAATEEEIQTFKSNQLFYVADDSTFAQNVRGITIRKKIARILDMGTLSGCSIEKIREKSLEMGINVQLENGKVVIPSTKADLKSLLAFLAEEMYKGSITNKTYLTNSSRAIDK